MARVNLYFGDVREKIKLIPDSSMDLIYWDYPVVAESEPMYTNTFVPVDDLLEELNRIAKPNCRLLVHGSQPLCTEFIWRLKDFYDTTWYLVETDDKKSGVMRSKPMSIVKEVHVFTLNPIGDIPHYTPPGAYNDPNGGLNIRKFAKNFLFEEPLDHPKFTPDEQNFTNLEYLIRTYSAFGDNVLDLFMGSGSLAIACLNAQRVYHGIELHETIFRIASERITSHMDSIEYRRAISPVSKKKKIDRA